MKGKLSETDVVKIGVKESLQQKCCSPGLKQRIDEHSTEEQRNQVKIFYDAKIKELDKAQKLICREATIQVILQLTLIFYQEIFIISYLLTS